MKLDQDLRLLISQLRQKQLRRELNKTKKKLKYHQSRHGAYKKLYLSLK